MIRKEKTGVLPWTRRSTSNIIGWFVEIKVLSSWRWKDDKSDSVGRPSNLKNAPLKNESNLPSLEPELQGLDY